MNLLVPFLVLCSCLPADESPNAPRVRVTDRLGSERDVHVLALEGEQVRLRGEIGGGLAIWSASLAEFEPRSRYRILLAAAPPADATQHFALARRTGEWRLIDTTMRHLRTALRLAEGEAEPEAAQARIRAWTAHWLDAVVRESLLRGDVDEAKRRLSSACTQLTGNVVCQRLLALHEAVDAAATDRRATKERERLARLSAAEQRERDRRLQPILEALTRADGELRQSKVMLHRTAESRRRAATAQRLYEGAIARIDRLPAADENDELRQRARAGRLDAVMQHAEASTVQGDFRSALKTVGEVLAQDPDHRRARQLLDTIQIANSVAAGWPFGVVVSGPAVR